MAATQTYLIDEIRNKTNEGKRGGGEEGERMKGYSIVCRSLIFTINGRLSLIHASLFEPSSC
jgi:hypothetical protein